MGIEFVYEINLTGLFYDGNQVVGVQGLETKKTSNPSKNCQKL